jgi:hypothetical protein
LFAVVGGDEEDRYLHLMDLKEESPLAEAIAPSGGLPVLQPLNIRANIGVLAQGGVDIVAEFGFEANSDGGDETREILRKLARLEDSKRRG